MEMFACLFIIGLSFLFHLIVYENDYVEKWYWKVLGGGAKREVIKTENQEENPLDILSEAI